MVYLNPFVVVTLTILILIPLCPKYHNTTIIAVRSVNSTVPQLVQNMRAVRVFFDESVFDAQAVRVMLSSNCTQPVIVDYTNPAEIIIPYTGLNTGQCLYLIQLVDGNLRQVGYSLSGFFIADGNILSQ